MFKTRNGMKGLKPRKGRVAMDMPEGRDIMCIAKDGMECALRVQD